MKRTALPGRATERASTAVSQGPAALHVAAGPVAAHPISRLQRTAGNRAVRGLIESGRAGGVAVQRDESADEVCDTAVGDVAPHLVGEGAEQRARTFGQRLTSAERRVWAGLSPAGRADVARCTASERASLQSVVTRRIATVEAVHERLANLSGRIHAAMDVSSPRHTPVYVPIAGNVVQAERTEGIYGWVVSIVHQCPPPTREFGQRPVVTVYAHMDGIDVTPGASVAAGDQIGRVGDSGVEGRVHLHFSVRYLGRRERRPRASSEAEESEATRINPRDWLAALGVSVGPVTPVTSDGAAPDTSAPASSDDTSASPSSEGTPAPPAPPIVARLPAGIREPVGAAPTPAPRSSTTAAVQRDPVVQRVTDEERYLGALTAAGTTQAAWEAGYGAGTFLAVAVGRGLHRDLQARLDLAQTSLLSQFPGSGPADLATQLGLRTISGRRGVMPAVGGSRLSFHSFGLAIDVNYSTNPFIGRSAAVDTVIDRIHQFMLGTEFHIASRQEGAVEEVRARYAAASQAFAQYFAMRGDTDAIRRFLATRREVVVLAADSPLINPWQEEDDARVAQVAAQIEADAQNPALLADMEMTGAGPRDPTAGFMDLGPALVTALTGPAGLTWGGQYSEAKDMMHFDWRGGTVRNHHRR